MKILCLHGYITNANIMKYQMSLIMQDNKEHDFDFINAPNISNETYPEIKFYFPNEQNYYAWFNRNNNELEGLEKSISELEKIIKKYDIVIGFSQGASMVSILIEKKLVTKAILIAHGIYCPIIKENCETLHLIGLKDEYKECGENAYKIYSVNNNPQLYYFNDVHKVPNDKETICIIKEFLKEK